MVKRAIVIYLFFWSIGIVAAQVPDTLWTRTYGGASYEWATWIEPAHDSGWVTAGYTASFGEGNRDMYIIKTRPDGSTEWAYTYGGENDDVANDIKRTVDGGYIVCGYSNSYQAGSFYHIMKINSAGAFEWWREYGGDTSANYGYGICQMQDTGFLIVGSVYCHTIHGYDWDIYVVKTDAAGNLLNEYQIIRANSQHGFRVIPTDDGGAIMVSGMGNSLIIKFNAAGDTVWSHGYPGSSSINSIIQLEDGGYAALGYRDRGYSIEDQFWLLRLNTIGDTIWTRYYGAIYPDVGYCLQQTHDGGFIMAGEMYPVDLPIDVFVVRAAANGDLLWSTHIGGVYEDYSYSVQCTPDSGYVIAGRTRSFGNGDFDYYFIRLGPDTLLSTGVEGEDSMLPTEIELEQNYPNPFNNQTVIEYFVPAASPVVIDIFDIHGRKVKSVDKGLVSAGYHQEAWDAGKNSSGVYFYRISAGSYSETKKMVLMK